MIRVLVADDHKIVRDGLEVLLGAIEGITVIGTASDGIEAASAAHELEPDVVVMDVSMPGASGVEAARRIAVERPAVKVLMLTMNEDIETIRSAMRAGACGYVLKGAGAEELEQAIRLAHAGGTVFSGAVGARVADVLAGREAPPPAPFPQLTEREREILELLAAGRSNAEIASRIYLADKSVRNLVSGIYTKLGVSDRVEAIIKAREAGLGDGGG